MKAKRMDCYPWAVPTEEQKRMFDAKARLKNQGIIK